MDDLGDDSLYALDFFPAQRRRSERFDATADSKTEIVNITVAVLDVKAGTASRLARLRDSLRGGRRERGVGVEESAPLPSVGVHREP